jgi:hypothetical protein
MKCPIGLGVAALAHAEPDSIQRGRDDVRHTAIYSMRCPVLAMGEQSAP